MIKLSKIQELVSFHKKQEPMTRSFKVSKIVLYHNDSFLDQLFFCMRNIHVCFLLQRFANDNFSSRQSFSKMKNQTDVKKTFNSIRIFE